MKYLAICVRWDSFQLFYDLWLFKGWLNPTAVFFLWSSVLHFLQISLEHRIFSLRMWYRHTTIVRNEGIQSITKSFSSKSSKWLGPLWFFQLVWVYKQSSESVCSRIIEYKYSVCYNDGYRFLLLFWRACAKNWLHPTIKLGYGI